MTKKSYLVAALIGLLVCLTVAWKQDAPAQDYRNVLRGLVGQTVEYHKIEGGAELAHPPRPRWSHVTILRVGSDFVELGSEGDTQVLKIYVPIGNVVLWMTSDK